MKFLLFSIITLLFVSCSDENTESNNILLKRMTETVDSNTSTSVFKYKGDKIVNQVDDVKSFTYEYAGNLIAKRTFQVLDTPNHKSEQMYQYDSNNRLSQMVELHYYGPGAPSGRKTIYTYHSDNTISYVEYKGTLETQNTQISTGTYYLDEIGEVSQLEKKDNEGEVIMTIDFIYDSNSNPFKNVIGYDKLFHLNKGKNHNVVSVTTSTDTDTSSNVSYSYEYDDNDYPTGTTITFPENTTVGSNIKEIAYFYE